MHVIYGDYLSATFALPLDVKGIHSTSGNHLDIGFFNSGTGNIGAFNGLGNSDASDGNDNIGVFNGDANGGKENGDGNIGAFNGNFNGLGNASPSDGNNNGNGNVGVLNGNYNGNLNVGHDSGNGNGNGNVGVDSGNLNGNGVSDVALHGEMDYPSTSFVGIDTIVAGNGSDSITALAGISTIVAGNGNDQILIGGSYNLVFAGNGADHVVGVNVDHTTIALGNGGCTVNLTGAGCNTVTPEAEMTSFPCLAPAIGWTPAQRTRSIRFLVERARIRSCWRHLDRGWIRYSISTCLMAINSICKMICRTRTGMGKLATLTTFSRPR